MSDQPDQPEDAPKPVVVGIIGHMGFSRHSRSAALQAALQAIAKLPDTRIVLVGPDSAPKLDWDDLKAMQVCEAPKPTRPPQFDGDRTYPNAFSRRNRKRRR